MLMRRLGRTTTSVVQLRELLGGTELRLDDDARGQLDAASSWHDA